MSEITQAPVKEEKKPLVRFGEFEFLKALAIMGLPFVHVMEEAMEASLSSPQLNALGMSVVVLCIFGPSLFMICMGFGIGGGKTSPDSVMRTGVQFLLIGALLNILRWLIPGTIESFVLDQPVMSSIDLCLQSDIYYFVGLYFVAYSFLKRLNLSTASILCISFLTLTVNNMLTPFIQAHVTNDVAIALLGNIIYVDETSCFPLMSWLIFPTTGVLLGEILKKADDNYRETFMRRLLDVSVVVTIGFSFFLYNYGIDIIMVIVSPANNYITDFPNVVMLIALALILICLTYYLCKYIGHSKFMAFMLRISAFIVPFYLLQWILIAWLFYGLEMARAPEGSFTLIYYIIAVAIVMTICIVVSIRYGMKIMKVLVKYTYIKKKKKKKNGSSKKSTGASKAAKAAKAEKTETIEKTDKSEPSDK